MVVASVSATPFEVEFTTNGQQKLGRTGKLLIGLPRPCNGMHGLAQRFAGWYGINVGAVCRFPYDFFLVKEEVEQGGDLVSGFEKQFGTLLLYLLITCFNHLSEV